MTRKKVLIVEKQGIIALDVQHLLKEMGYNIVGINSNLKEVEEQLLNDKPDLVISDYTMHESAINFTEKVVLKYKVPIIYITGSITAGSSKSSLMENCAVIAKPFSNKEFKQIVNEMIGRNLKV